MKFVAIVDGAETEVDVDTFDETIYSLEIGGERHHVDARHLEGDTWSLLIDGQSYEVDVSSEGDEKLLVRLRGGDHPMAVLDERRMRMRQVAGGFEVEGRATVVAPMPGKVVRLLVSEGDEVQEGDGVAVVEAMKMENELRAPKDGRVVELPIAEGKLVEAQTVLVVIE